MFRRPAFRRFPLAAVALCVLVAGCTAGDDDSPAEPDTRTTTGVTEDAVTVRVPEGAEPQAVIGAAARIERANADGGVHGRRVILDEDPTGDTFAHLPASGDSLDPAAGDDDGTTPDIAHRPVFGAASNTSFCNVDYAFAVDGCQARPSDIWGSLVSLVGDESSPDGATAVIVAGGAPDTDNVPDMAAPSFEHAGFTVDVIVRFEEDFATVDAVLASEPDVVVYASSDEASLATAETLVEAGFKGIQTFRTAYSPEFAAAAAEAGLGGITVLTDFAPFESADENPIVQRMIDDVREYEETEGLPETPLSGEVEAGYWSADAFLAALEATGSDLTVERFLQTANDDFEWIAEATAGPATWPRNRQVPVPCGALVEVAGDGTFDVAVPYSCGRNLT